MHENLLNSFSPSCDQLTFDKFMILRCSVLLKSVMILPRCSMVGERRITIISADMINAIGVFIDLVFLALFSILLYPLLTLVRMAKIVINFTPIVKYFVISPKLRKKTNFSEKMGKYTIRKCYQMILF